MVECCIFLERCRMIDWVIILLQTYALSPEEMSMVARELRIDPTLVEMVKKADGMVFIKQVG